MTVPVGSGGGGVVLGGVSGALFLARLAAGFGRVGVGSGEVCSSGREALVALSGLALRPVVAGARVSLLRRVSREDIVSCVEYVYIQCSTLAMCCPIRAAILVLVAPVPYAAALKSSTTTSVLQPNSGHWEEMEAPLEDNPPLTSFLLVGFKHHDAAARDSARQALLVTMTGGLALLGGLMLLAQRSPR